MTAQILAGLTLRKTPLMSMNSISTTNSAAQLLQNVKMFLVTGVLNLKESFWLIRPIPTPVSISASPRNGPMVILT